METVVREMLEGREEVFWGVPPPLDAGHPASGGVVDGERDESGAFLSLPESGSG